MRAPSPSGVWEAQPLAGLPDEVVDVSVIGSLFRAVGRKQRVMGGGAAVLFLISIAVVDRPIFQITPE